MNIRAEIIVSGFVQGVGYRWFVNQVAQNLKLKGTVINNFDSTVTVIAEGNKEDLEMLIIELKKGPPKSKVNELTVQWKQPTNLFINFKII